MGRFGDADSGLTALLAEDRDNLVRHLDPLLAQAPGELVGFELLEDLLKGEIDQGMVPVRSVGEYSGRRGFAQFSEGDADDALRQLRQDLAGGHGNAHAAGGGLLDFGLEGIGELQDHRTQGDLDQFAAGRS
jgi:hypothetical protein